MVKTDNLNIVQAVPLSPPALVRRELPVSVQAADTVVSARADIQAILARRDRRHLMVVGPCSIHDMEGTREYARRLTALAAEVRERIVLVMRVYFEKPRTTLGWKGLIYDPRLDDSYDIEHGLRMARRVLLELGEMGLPAATEILEPVVPQYITDLVAWAAIGARTTESQTHRQMASGLSMPIGFKNATDGSMKVAVDAIRTAASPHAFIGITEDGRVGVFRTRGNPFGHLVLRGGGEGENYGPEYIAFARELMRKEGLIPNVVVDCSHGNSRKQPDRQVHVMREVVAQVAAGSDTIVGTMVESNLLSGRQDMPKDPAQLKVGLSLTDPCLGWEETEAMIREAYAVLKQA